MARNGTGTFNLVAGNPVVSGTTIQSSWANSTLSDIAAGLTQSLSRDGQAAMTGPLPMGAQDIQNAGNITANGNVNGAAFIPTLSTIPSNGMYFPAANTLGFATNSALRVSIDATGNVIATGNVTAAALIPSGSTIPVNGIYLSAANTLGFATNTGAVGTLTSAVLTMPALAVTGSTVPANGVYLSAANTLAFATNTVLRLSCSSTGAWTTATPTSGVAHTINGVAGATVLKLNAGASNVNAIQMVDPGANATELRLATTNTSTSVTATGNATVPLNLNVGGTTVISMSTAFNVQTANPTSGTGLVIGGVASSSTTVTAFGPTAGSQQDLTPDTGSFTGTLTGCTTSPTATISFRRVGRMVTLFMPQLVATSNSTACTITGLPAALQPVTTQGCSCNNFSDNGVNAGAGTQFQMVGASGTINLARNGNNNGWTAAGSKGVQGNVAWSYVLD